MRSQIISLGLFFCFSLSILSQEKFQFNFILGPSYEKIGTRNANIENPFSFKYSYNIGSEFKYYLSPKVSSNLGLSFNDKGFQSNIDYDVFGDTVSSSVRISAKYLTLPFDLAFNFTPAFRTEYFFSTGITYGYLLSQTFKGQRVPEELGRPNNPLFEGVTNEKNNISWFDKSYFAAQLGAGISRYVKSRMLLTFHASYAYQLDRLINPEGPIIQFATTNSGQLVEYSPKLNSFLLLLKVGYYFSDQIENTKKEL